MGFISSMYYGVKITTIIHNLENATALLNEYYKKNDPLFPVQAEHCLTHIDKIDELVAKAPDTIKTVNFTLLGQELKINDIIKVVTEHISEYIIEFEKRNKR